MKKIAIACMLFASGFKLSAQIPNSGFETWNNAGTYLNPDEWWTPNDSISSGSFYPVTRSSDHYPASIGNYSIRFENNTALAPNWGSMGLAWTGGWAGSNYPVFPIAGHPTSLHGYYKFLPQNNDTMEVHIRLYKNGIDIGGGAFKDPATVSNWTLFSMNFTNYTDVDSARIMILSCYDNDAPVPHGNSVLYIDNLSFDSPITSVSEQAVKNRFFNFYPNPAKDFLILTYPPISKTDVFISIYDVLGKLMCNQPLRQNQEKINISGLSDGIYFVEIKSADWKAVQKLNICR